MNEIKTNKEKNKRYIPLGIAVVILIVLSVGLAILFRRSPTISGVIDVINSIIRPFVYGVAFAFLLSPVYNLLRRHMHAYLATLICLVIVLAIMFLLGWLIIPQLIASVGQVISNLPEYGNRLIQFLGDKNIASAELEQFIRNYTEDFGLTISVWFTDEFIPNIGKYAVTLSSGLVSILMVLKDFFIGIIIMVYTLNMKTQFKAQLKKLCYSVLSVDKANAVVTESRFVKEVFSKFIIGKIIDSLIIGVLTFIVIKIFDIPYSVLIAVIVGVTNVIPYFGPFIGAIPCGLLLLLISPVKCLEFCIIILIIQQIDGNIIGPKILGEATGVSSFWVLFSILVFGGLFGMIGMIIAVPAFAVIMRLVKKTVDNKLESRHLSTDTGDYVNLERVDAETHDYVKHDGSPMKFGENLQEVEEPVNTKKQKDNNQDVAIDDGTDGKEDN